MIAGRLIKQLPKPSKPIDGVMTAEDKKMYWWDDPTTEMGMVLAELHLPEILSASTKGIHFKGFESGFDKKGRETLKYQEWWITSIPATTEEKAETPLKVTQRRYYANAFWSIAKAKPQSK